MKNLILLLMTSLIFISTSNAQDIIEQNECVEMPLIVEENNFYIKALGGVNFIETRWKSRTINPGLFISGALGYHYNDEIRLETEFSKRSNTSFYRQYWGYNKINSETTSCMINVLWDIPTAQNFSFYNFNPFLGLGLGADFYGTITPNFTWQFICGIKRPIDKKIDISFEYIVHRSNQSVALGLIYKFGNKYCY